MSAGGFGPLTGELMLDAPEEVAAVRERVRATCIEAEEQQSGGFLMRDPWEIAVLFVTPKALTA